MKSLRVTIQMKATFTFIMLYKLVLTFKSVYEILMCDHSDDRYWAVLLSGSLSTMLYRVVPTFDYLDEIPKCSHSSERYWAALGCFGSRYLARSHFTVLLGYSWNWTSIEGVQLKKTTDQYLSITSFRLEQFSNCSCKTLVVSQNKWSAWWTSSSRFPEIISWIRKN